MKKLKYIKQFENFDTNSIDVICEQYGIENYTINDDGSIDVEGNVDLSDEGLDELPLKFGKINGDFNCNLNNITSLDGAPYHVELTFDCSENKLSNLEGCPKYVGESFYCYLNFLNNLEGSPEYVGFEFNCYNNNLNTILGLVTDIGEEFVIEGYLKILYDILKENLDYIPNFYDFHIVDYYENKKRPSINLKRLNRFIELYELKELSEEQLTELKLYYNII